MQTAKQEVMELLKVLPDNSTLEEIQYHLYVRQKVQMGLKDVEQGKIFSQAGVEKRMEKWLVKQFGLTLRKKILMLLLSIYTAIPRPMLRLSFTEY